MNFVFCEGNSWFVRNKNCKVIQQKIKEREPYNHTKLVTNIKSLECENHVLQLLKPVPQQLRVKTIFH